MTNETKKRNLKLAIVVLGIALVAGVASVGWWWKEQQAMSELGNPGLILINYTDDDVSASVHNSKFPNPGEGASYDVGPHGGGGVMCCVPIPTMWRPGIKMIVRYHFGKWPESKEVTRIVELPEYPGGKGGSLYLVFHSETDIELMSTMFGPRHPRWPGRRVEPMLEGVEQ